jgi:hypothetical protein
MEVCTNLEIVMSKNKPKTKKKASKNKPKTKKKASKNKPKEETLSPQHMMFCNLYVKNSDLFGNATMCYADAFGFELESLSQEAIYSDPDEFGHKELLEDSPYTKAYNVCSVNGNRLLRNAKIDDYIKVLLNELMTNENADAELAWVMKQRKDLGPKIQALREFNKLKNRIINEFVFTDNRVDPKLKNETDNKVLQFMSKNGKGTTKSSK